MKRKNNAGFTLIELMIVVAIIAILAAVAYPAYTAQVRSTTRAEMQGLMQDFAVTMEQYRSQHFRYTGATVAAQGAKLATSTKYGVALAIPTAQTYVLTATPTVGSSQEGDGVMKIDNQGRACYLRGGADCTLGDASQAW